VPGRSPLRPCLHAKLLETLGELVDFGEGERPVASVILGGQNDQRVGVALAEPAVILVDGAGLPLLQPQQQPIRPLLGADV